MGSTVDGSEIQRTTWRTERNKLPFNWCRISSIHSGGSLGFAVAGFLCFYPSGEIFSDVYPTTAKQSLSYKPGEINILKLEVMYPNKRLWNVASPGGGPPGAGLHPCRCAWCCLILCLPSNLADISDVWRVAIEPWLVQWHKLRSESKSSKTAK